MQNRYQPKKEERKKSKEKKREAWMKSDNEIPDRWND